MDLYSFMYDFIAQNKDLFRFLYSAVIAFICLIIVIKTDRLFRISSHQGIRYFRNAFLFYGVGFLIRYLLATPLYFNVTRLFFEFFMIMGGFFLLYSLLWKRFENSEKPSISSLFNSRISIFYGLAIIIVVLDYLWGGYTFMFISQIILFAFASIISYKNYINRKGSFLKLYFAVMILSFLAWTLNFIFASFSGRLRWFANVYALNVIVFLVFLYGVIKVTKK